MTEPIVGIVIPAYNAERFIARTLDSIIAQTFADWQCIIINDGSKDQTADTVAHYALRDPRIRLIHQSNGGVSSARNRGFAELPANVPYVTFMDQDDLWTPTALATLVGAIEKEPAAVGVHGLADMIDEAGQPVGGNGFSNYLRKRYTLHENRIVDLPIAAPADFISLAYLGHIYPPGIILARRSAYEKVGPWDESFKAVQDWDMTIRLSRHGYFRLIDQVLLYYRRHNSNGSDDHARNVRETRALYQKTFFSPDNTPGQREQLAAGWKAFQRYRIAEKKSGIGPSLRKGNIVQAGKLMGHVLAHSARMVRGYPSAKGI